MAGVLSAGAGVVHLGLAGAHTAQGTVTAAGTALDKPSLVGPEQDAPVRR